MQNTSSAQPLLIELLTEELPPKALNTLGQAFANGVHTLLKQHQLLSPDCVVTDYATPRRLAVVINSVLQQAPDHDYTEKLMPAKVGLSESGEMTPALVKRLASKGLAHLTVDDLTVESDGKQDQILYKGVATGTKLADGLQEALDYAITHLPIPKVMHYQLANGESVRFVRPVHGLLALWGSDVIPVTALGLTAGRTTQGHRFLSQGVISIPCALDYNNLLYTQGHVVASFSQRREQISQQLQEQANKLDSTISQGPDVVALLDEVTALVEHPSVYVGEFDKDFLRVPPECLILTMRLNQKYFPLFEPDTGMLTHRFLVVSNMNTPDPTNIIEGNERVVRPRLADAQFFFDTDLKIPLADRVERLKDSVYHHKLGSQLERTQRVQATATYLAGKLGADTTLCERAAWLAKADLESSMVGEFPELQGVMGAWYAKHDGEAVEVAQAIGQQYRLRVDSPVNTDTITATILFLAERVETLVGIWGIGLKPTGERDPFGLRRAALGIISAYEQLTAGGYLDIARTDSLDLDQLLAFAASQFPAGTLNNDTVNHVVDYIRERYRNQLIQQADRQVVDAVLAVTPPLHQVQARVHACMRFAAQPEAASLAAANKRITNILRRAPEHSAIIEPELLQEPAELELARCIAALQPQARHLFDQGDFSGTLVVLAQSKHAVDDFFDHVMIMTKDPAIQANRLALLQQLHLLMNQVADISRLAS